MCRCDRKHAVGTRDARRRERHTVVVRGGAVRTRLPSARTVTVTRPALAADLCSGWSTDSDRARTGPSRDFGLARARAKNDRPGPRRVTDGRLTPRESIRVETTAHEIDFHRRRRRQDVRGPKRFESLFVYDS